MTTPAGASRPCVVCGVEVHERALKSGPVWCSSGPGAHTICEKSPDYHHHPDLGSESGHTFRVSVECRGSSSVVGVEGHMDAEEFEPLPRAVEVRAWNLPDALTRAAHRPLSAWFPDEDPSDKPYAPHHGPGNDPYIVFDHGTDEDRRTSFRGELNEPA